MRKQIYIFAALVCLALVNFAQAHPLGNFSVNQFSGVEIGKKQTRVRQILDLAEIPTFQESQKIDSDKNGELSREELNRYADALTPAYLSNLKFSVENQSIELRAESKNIEL